MLKARLCTRLGAGWYLPRSSTADGASLWSATSRKTRIRGLPSRISCSGVATQVGLISSYVVFTMPFIPLGLKPLDSIGGECEAAAPGKVEDGVSSVAWAADPAPRRDRFCSSAAISCFISSISLTCDSIIWSASLRTRGSRNVRPLASQDGDRVMRNHRPPVGDVEHSLLTAD